MQFLLNQYNASPVTDLKEACSEFIKNALLVIAEVDDNLLEGILNEYVENLKSELTLMFQKGDQLNPYEFYDEDCFKNGVILDFMKTAIEPCHKFFDFTSMCELLAGCNFYDYKNSEYLYFSVMSLLESYLQNYIMYSPFFVETV